MPRGFSPKDRERICRDLMDKGRDIFCRYGLEKTSIRDLTRAVGIGQGTFYRFFPSKEVLLFRILEEEEKAIQERFLEEELIHAPNPEHLQKAFWAALEAIEERPLFKELLQRDTYGELLAKLPPGILEEHRNRDFDTLEPVLKSWVHQGYIREEDTEVIAGLFRGVFLLSLHKEEIGTDVYAGVMQLLLHFMAQGLLGEEMGHERN